MLLHVSSQCSDGIESHLLFRSFILLEVLSQIKCIAHTVCHELVSFIRNNLRA